jgi:hypothetical protein
MGVTARGAPLAQHVALLIVSSGAADATKHCR